MIIEKDADGRPYSTYSHLEYHNVNEYIGSSTLKKIDSGSTDYILIETKDKIEFKIGNAFELLVQDKVLLSKEFEDFYFVTKLNTRPSDIFEIIKNRNADEFIQKNKDGSLKKLEKNHWMEELVKNDYKFPLKMDEKVFLDQMVENFLKMDFKGIKMDNCICNAIIERPMLWENGIKKKCKPDFFFFVEDEIFLFDIKTYGKNIEQFKYDFQRMGYWVQAVHYKEGVEFHYPDYKVNPMSFAVSSKQDPYLSQIYTLDSNPMYKQMEADYLALCDKYSEWDLGGRIKKGYKTEEGQVFYKSNNN